MPRWSVLPHFPPRARGTSKRPSTLALVSRVDTSERRVMRDGIISEARCHARVGRYITHLSCSVTIFSILFQPSYRSVSVTCSQSGASPTGGRGAHEPRTFENGGGGLAPAEILRFQYLFLETYDFFAFSNIFQCRSGRNPRRN